MNEFKSVSAVAMYVREREDRAPNSTREFLSLIGNMDLTDDELREVREIQEEMTPNDILVSIMCDCFECLGNNADEDFVESANAVLRYLETDERD